MGGNLSGGHSSSMCKCRRASACFLLIPSFLLVAALSFYASPDKFVLIFGRAKKQIGNFTTHKEYDVWPSSKFWQSLTQDRARRVRNTCAFSGCQSTHASSDQSQSHSQFKYPFDSKQECPLYFRYIHEDLSPWNHAEPTGKNDAHSRGGISKRMLDKGTSLANFRFVIKKGRLYVEPLIPCFQTRAMFTIWGLLQLLQFYPGLVPDVDMLFGCGDTPRVFKRSYKNPLVSPPPPVFRYCSTPLDFDIPFPDWTFWGWPEVNLQPWDSELFDILKGENELLWEERHPTAFWRGNTDTGSVLRKELQRCSQEKNGPTVIHQDWSKEIHAHFKHSKLAQQCKHRYKIYAEGRTWSVSLKYIMACDSPTFLIDPVFHDFSSRGLSPLKHYWPVRHKQLCHSIKFGTEWGNNNTNEAETIGRAGRQYVIKEMSMKYVYDYMLHALYEYSKLLNFEPLPGPNMKEVCTDAFLCQAPVQEKVLYRKSTVKQRSEVSPCFLPPRDEALIQKRLSQRLNITKIIHNAEESADGGDHQLIPHLLHG